MSARAFDDVNTPADTAVEVLMAVMLLVLPLAYGATEAWSREIWFLLVAVMGVCVLGKAILYRDTRLVWTWAYVPIVLFIGLVLLQAVRLPPGVVRVLSPSATAVRADLLHDLPDALKGPQTISLYPHATWEELSWVLATAAVFVIALQVYRDARRVRRLLITITLAGLAVAALAAYQDATNATMIYGIVPIGHKNAGPFQNYSHFSQFMNLSIGAALGLVLMTLTEWAAADPDPAALLDELRRPAAWPVWAAGTLCVVGPVLVFWSLSRMGMISMLVAGGVSAAVLGARAGRGGRRGGGAGGVSFLFVGLGVAVFAAVLAFGFDVIYDRLATLRHSNASTVARWQILHDLLPLYRQYPVLGTGLGTYEFVFPVFNHLDVPHIATHAEDEYAQILAECGGVGLALALAFAACVVVAFFRATWRPRRPVQFAAFGLGFGLIAIAVHSFSDFGQHVPADAVLTALSAAVLINSAALARTAAAPALVRPRRNALFLWARVAGLAAFACGAAWVLWAGDVDRRAEAAWSDTQTAADPLVRAGWQGSDDAYRALLTAAAQAADLSPDNVVYRYWLNVYRWQLVSRDVDPQTHRPQLSDADVGFARQIADAFDAARVLCPMFGPPLGVAGQIRASVFNDPLGETQVRTAYRLTPFDAMVCRTAGVLAVRRGDWRTAQTALTRYVLLGGQRRDVIDVYLAAGRPDLARAMAAGHRGDLDYLATQTNDPTVAAAARAESESLLDAEADRPDADGETLAARGRGEAAAERPVAAAAWYERAVQTDYARLDWRVQLARADAACGRFGEAVRQLKICLRLRPQFAEAEQLMAAYSGRAAVEGPPAADAAGK